MTRKGFWREILAELRAGHPVFLAWVAAATEHSPGTRGARLFLSASGKRHGTIGGGIMEKKLEDRARELLAVPPPAFFERRLLHHSREAAGERSGMICAGSQENVGLLLHPAQAAQVESLLEHLERDAEGDLVLGPDGVAVAQGGEARPGEYREPLRNPHRIAIFGGGHCGQALARQMATLGDDVLLLETRAAVLPANPAKLGDEVEIRVVEDFRAAALEVARPELTPAVVMTTDFPSDVKALEGALRQPFPFLGLMGSPAKLAEIRTRLLALGFGEEDLARLEAPVGLPIGSRTPPEIAVSIAARILEWRSDGPIARK